MHYSSPHYVHFLIVKKEIKRTFIIFNVHVNLLLCLCIYVCIWLCIFFCICVCLYMMLFVYICGYGCVCVCKCCSDVLISHLEMIEQFQNLTPWQPRCSQDARRCSHPAPRSQTPVCLEPVPKEPWSPTMWARREKLWMGSCPSSFTRDRTSPLMRFYSRCSGESDPCFRWHQLTSSPSFYEMFVLSAPNCSSSEGRPFRLGTGANMEKVVKMDRDMIKVQEEV